MIRPVITNNLVPVGHRFGPAVAVAATRSIVVPRCPAQVILLTWVARLVTDTPAPPVALTGVHPLRMAVLVRASPTTADERTTRFVQCAMVVTAEARPTNGASASDAPAIVIAARQRRVGRRINFPP